MAPGAPGLGRDLADLGRNLLNQGKSSEAELLLRESIATFEKTAPDDWRSYDAISLLGAALLGRGRFLEAEPLVVRGYEGMKAREDRIPAARKPLLTAAAMQVVRLYEELGKNDQAKAWKKKLGLADLPVDVFTRPRHE